MEGCIIKWGVVCILMLICLDKAFWTLATAHFEELNSPNKDGLP